MTYLLDTHSLIWFFEQNEQLSFDAKNILKNKVNKIATSIVNFWEIAIKMNVNKLVIENTSVYDLMLFCGESEIKIIPIHFWFLNIYATLPLIHRDPFDRLMIAMCIADNYTLITNDKSIKNYDIKTLW